MPSHQDTPGNEKANDLAEAGRLQNPLNFDLPFNVPPTLDGLMEHTEDMQDCPDPARRLDFDTLLASAHSHSSDTVSMSSSDDTPTDTLPPVGECDALHLDSPGLCEMHSPLVHLPMFWLDSDPELDTLAPRTPPLTAFGLEAMPTPSVSTLLARRSIPACHTWMFCSSLCQAPPGLLPQM